MNDLIIHKTASTPEIEFKCSGNLSIKGVSLPEDPHSFFTPLFNWINELSVDQVHINVRLEYVNTSSSKRILQLIQNLDTHTNIKDIELNWFYEVDDEDMLEFGELIEARLKRTKAYYFECEEE